jgi:predicted glutamine amidotransferase
MRKWLFAHTGTIERFSAIEESLRASLPEFMQRNVRGTTDSELLFHLVLSFLHDAGHLDAPAPREQVVTAAIRSAVALVDRLCAEVKAPTSPINMVLTEGRTMYALRRGGPMAYVERRGIHDADVDDPPSRTKPTTLRYVMVVAEDVGDLAADWHSLESGELLVVDRQLDVHRHPL